MEFKNISNKKLIIRGNGIVRPGEIIVADENFRNGNFAEVKNFTPNQIKFKNQNKKSRRLKNKIKQ